MHSQNPFAQSPVYWTVSFTTPVGAVPVVESLFAGEAVAVSSFEQDETTGIWAVELLLSQPPAPEWIAEKLARLPEGVRTQLGAAQIEKIEPRDWRAAVATQFPPFRVGRFYLHGSHVKEKPPVSSLAIVMDAGTAFGSGEHATTKGCLRALEAIAKKHRIAYAADVGTGSGILAIGLAKAVRPCRIVAGDMDKVSVLVARENAKINRTASRIAFCHAAGMRHKLFQRGNAYDVTIANILARPLMKLARDIAPRTAPGGYIVLSGLLARQANMVAAAFRYQKRYLRWKILIDGWATLILHSYQSIGKSAADIPLPPGEGGA